LAVAPPLIPFVKQADAPDPADVDDGLYNFLSPRLPPTNPPKGPKKGAVVRATLPNGTPIPEKPEWFQKGYHVSQLLKEAEGLNWLLDGGVPIGPEEIKRPATTTSISW
jgi:hypothetical protein